MLRVRTPVLFIIIDNAFNFDKLLLPTFFFVVYTIFDICKRKSGQKQVKKKAFKINAKIEDVGLNED